jgi:hypothetical protein
MGQLQFWGNLHPGAGGGLNFGPVWRVLKKYFLLYWFQESTLCTVLKHLRPCLFQNTEAIVTRLSRLEEKAVEDCEIILDCYSRNLKRPKSEDEFEACSSNNNKDWAHGRKHIFLSEGARQQLEQLRETRRQAAATKIQVFAAHLLFLLSVAVAFMYLHTGIFETVPRILLQGVHRNLCHKCLGQQIQDGLDVASDTVSYCCYCSGRYIYIVLSATYKCIFCPFLVCI